MTNTTSGVNIGEKESCINMMYNPERLYSEELDEQFIQRYWWYIRLNSPTNSVLDTFLNSKLYRLLR